MHPIMLVASLSTHRFAKVEALYDIKYCPCLKKSWDKSITMCSFLPLLKGEWDTTPDNTCKVYA